MELKKKISSLESSSDYPALELFKIQLAQGLLLLFLFTTGY